jgi:hypothetical protein
VGAEFEQAGGRMKKKPLTTYRLAYCTRCAEHGRPGKYITPGEERYRHGDRVVVSVAHAAGPCPWCGESKWAGVQGTEERS